MQSERIITFLHVLMEQLDAPFFPHETKSTALSSSLLVR